MTSGADKPDWVGRRSSLAHWILFVEMGVALTLAWIAKRLLSFSRMSRILGRPVKESSTPDLPLPFARRVVWVFDAWRRRWPWPPVCLTEVLALSMILRRRGLRGTSFLGVRSIQGEFQAHAWVVCGTQILPRWQDVSSYRVLSVYEPVAPLELATSLPHEGSHA